MPAVGALLVDARPVDHPTARQRGIGRYVTGLLRGLTEIGAPVVALFGSDVEAVVLADAVPGLTLRRWSPQAIRDVAEPGTWYLATQLMLHPVPLDPIPSIVTEARLPVAAVMYDVIPYRFPETYLVEPNARVQAALRAPLARTLDAMLAISQFSAETAAEELAYPTDRMRVIGAGVEPQFTPAGVWPLARADRVLPRDVVNYVVAVTGGDERKNTEGLLRAWALLDAEVRASHRLVVATAAAPTVLDRWQRWATELGVEHDVVFTGEVTDDEMVSLLQGARLAVMPSLEEGFGLPVVEAAACGCPVICSDVSALPEVLEEPAACFDPRDPASIARAIERGVRDEAHREVLATAAAGAASRWTWRNVAIATIDALAELGPRWPQRLRAPSRRIAFAGPFAGSGSGIGRYDEAVLDSITRRAEAPGVTVLVDGSDTPHPTGADEHRFPVRALGRYLKPWNVDHIVTVLGSSQHHVATVEAAERFPTHVWLHEASLVGAHVGLAHAAGSHDWAVAHVTERLRDSERPEILAALAGADVLDAELLHAVGVTFLAPVLDRARSVIVSSDVAASKVCRVRSDGPPLLVLPHAHHPLRPPSSAPASADVVAVGWLAANKSPTLVVDVLARLVEQIPDITLSFVGPAVEATIDLVRDTAAVLGVGDRISFTGRLDDAEFVERLGRARAGLQLRDATLGEMSGAVADLISCGVPVVTTLVTEGPSSDGVRIVGADTDAITSALLPILMDDATWRAASADALDRAARWTFDDVADALLTWLDEADELPRGTVRHARRR